MDKIGERGRGREREKEGQGEGGGEVERESFVHCASPSSSDYRFSVLRAQYSDKLQACRTMECHL